MKAYFAFKDCKRSFQKRNFFSQGVWKTTFVNEFSTFELNKFIGFRYQIFI